MIVFAKFYGPLKSGPPLRSSNAMPSAGMQLFELLVLAIPIATIAWTVTHEEIFREPRDWCKRKSEVCQNLFQRKFFYLFTCEFCFSFYVSALVLAVVHFHLLYPDWKGYVVACLSLVWFANIYMSVFARLRLDIKKERVEIANQEKGSKQPAALAGKI